MNLKIIKIIGWIWVIAGITVLGFNFLMKVIPRQYLDTRYLPNQTEFYNGSLIAVASIIIGIGLLKLINLVRIIAILFCSFFLVNVLWNIFAFDKYSCLDLLFTIPQLIILNLKSVRLQFHKSKITK